MRNRRLDWLMGELVSHTPGVLGKQRRKDEPHSGVLAGAIDDDHSPIAEFAIYERSASMRLSRRGSSSAAILAHRMAGAWHRKARFRPEPAAGVQTTAVATLGT